MKKGKEYTGIIKELRFPNVGIAETVDENGETVLCKVKNTLPGQTVKYILKKKRNGINEGQLVEVTEKAPSEQEPPCPHFGVCGGCQFLNLPYEEQLALKERQVKQLLSSVHIPKDHDEDWLNKAWEGIRPSPRTKGYRNKMEFSFGDSKKDGELELGLHKRGSFYDVVSVRHCIIVDEDYRKILSETLSYFRGKETPYYHKQTHKGYLRHLLVRKAERTGEILIDIITTSDEPQATICTEQDLISDYRDALLSLKLKGRIVGILHTINDSPADAVKNDHTDIVFGRDHFFEELLGLRFKITPFSFFQTNTLSAELLYGIAREYIMSVMPEYDLENGDRKPIIFDLYTGTGTIAQLMASVAKEVIGIEIVPEAVEAARENVVLNSIDNISFYTGDVLKLLDEIDKKPDIIILDPPRDGIHPKAIRKIIDYDVPYILYISCKPTSLARDLEAFFYHGYSVERVCAIDQFAGSGHVETVVLLTQRKPDMSIEIIMDEEDLELTRAEAKATYREITEYVKNKYGLNVTRLYIAQVKREFGIIEHENHNKGKEGHHVPQVPPEKREAIIDALRFFKMIE